MATNFGLLGAIEPSKTIATLPNQPQSSGGGDGIGDLFKGLTQLGSAIKGTFAEDTEQPQELNNPNTLGAQAATNNFGTSQFGQQVPQNGLANALTQGTQNTAIGDNNFLKAGQALMGKSEQDPIVKSYLAKANPGLDPSVTPWCAGFVGSVLNANGMKGTGSLAARSYLNYGQKVDQPSLGDIVVLSRGSDPSKGHVGFYAGQDRAGNPLIMGGNQGDTVSTKVYPAKNVLGYRRPPSGQEVQQFAQQNGIQSPEQLSAITLQQNNQNNQNMKPNQYIQSAAQGARVTYQDNPVMQRIATAQAILESGLTNKPSGLAMKNNFFGIKGSGTAGSSKMGTHEYIGGKRVNIKDSFAINKTPEDSFAQHRNLMSKPRYADVMSAKTFEEAANALVKAGYATDPAYAKKLIEIDRKYGNVQLAENTVTRLDKTNPRLQAETYSNGQTMRPSNQSQSNMPVGIPATPGGETGHDTSMQMTMNTQPVQPYAPIQQPTPQESARHNDLMRQLDNGRDDYSQNGRGINWQLLQALQQQRGQA